MIGIALAGVGTHRCGRAEVSIPDLSLEGPGIVRLRGENGSGKSTLLELLAGGIRPRTGSIAVCGVPATSSRARRWRRVARSEIALLPGLTLRRHAALFARAAGVEADAAVRALEADGLGTRIDSCAADLSTGERRRAWVRLTMLGDAPVLLLDEPFLGLDEAAAAALDVQLERWSTQRMVVLVDHGARELRGVAHEIRLGR